MNDKCMDWYTPGLDDGIACALKKSYIAICFKWTSPISEITNKAQYNVRRHWLAQYIKKKRKTKNKFLYESVTAAAAFLAALIATSGP